LIQLNNWKPLSLDTITDNQEELVANLFKEISSHITLKILTRSPGGENQSTHCIAGLKQKLMKAATEKHPSLLTNSDSHEFKEVIQQLLAKGEDGLKDLPQSSVAAINEWLDQLAVAEAGVKRKSPMTPSSTRFHPLSEVPRLERWFRIDSNPSKQKMMSYLHILNGAPYRRSNGKVTYHQLSNWFTNQRASHRSNGRTIGDNVENGHNIHSQQRLPSGAENGGIFNLAKLMGPTQPPTNFAAQQFANAFLKNQLLFGGFDPQNGAGQALSPQSLASGHLFDELAALGGRQSDGPASTHIPISHLPMDIAARFGGSSSSSKAQTGTDSSSHQASADHSGERMDGGSESPTGNDDMSGHDDGDSEDADDGGRKESDEASSPDINLDVISEMSPQQQVASLLNSHAGGDAAAAMAQFSMSSFMSSALAAAAAGNNGTSSPTPDRLCTPYSIVKTPSMKTDGEGRDPPNSQSTTPSSSHPNSSMASNAARSRLMFDPLSELPILEKWFEENPHPGWLQIEQYTDTLNNFPYRQNYPPISTHNVKIWFKNRRAKCKRLNLGDVGGKMLMSS
jgi:hypothetical protein